MSFPHKYQPPFKQLHFSLFTYFAGDVGSVEAEVWSSISTMAMVSSLVAWAEITAGTGSQHGIDKYLHLE